MDDVVLVRVVDGVEVRPEPVRADLQGLAVQGGLKRSNLLTRDADLLPERLGSALCGDGAGEHIQVVR